MNTSKKSTARMAAYCGLFIALSVIFSRFLSMPIPLGGVLGIRLGLGTLPIMLAGLFFGPVAGALTGLAADIIGFPLTGGTYFPGFTLSAMLNGILPALIMYSCSLKRDENGTRLMMHSMWQPRCFPLRLIIAVFITQMVTSVGLSTLWLTLMTGTAYSVFLVPRLISQVFSVPVLSFFCWSALSIYSRTGHFLQEQTITLRTNK